MATVRYLVNNVTESIDFYTKFFGFVVETQAGPFMAILNRQDLALWLAGPESSAAQPMPDGTIPVPGAWNRFVFEVDDIDSTVLVLKDKGMTFKNKILRNGGRAQILCEDPSGNVIELMQREDANEI